MKQRHGRVVAALFTLLVAVVPARAAGFSFFEQSAKASGQAGAWIARADDAAANWYNPAALVRLNGGEVQFGVNWLNIGADTSFTLNDPVAVAVSEGLGFGGVQNGNRYDAVANSATPAHLYYAQKINDRWAFGIGANNPFGLVSEWKDVPVTLSSRKADLSTYLVNPNFAYGFNDKWSIGFGVDYLAIEVRSFSRLSVINLGNSTTSNFTGEPVGTFTTSDLTGEGDAWGYNFGFLYRDKHYSVAGNYRSEMSPVVRGNLQFSGLPGNFLNSPASAKVNLPSEAFTGVAWTSQWADIEFAATWTQWNRFKQLSVVTPNPATSATLTENWTATWAYRLGVAVRLDKSGHHEIRFGGLHDASPVPVEQLRPSIPDSDRTGYTLGYGYKAKRWGLDVYAMQLQFKDVTANGSFFEGVVNGTYKSSILLVGLTGKYRF